MGGFPLKEHIEQFRVVQRRKDFLEIQLKLAGSAASRSLSDSGEIEKSIVSHFRSMLGIDESEAAIEVRFVDEIPLGKNGKLQIIESNL
jgi:hypothetical protein